MTAQYFKGGTMKKVLIIAGMLLVVVTGSVLAETGIGVSVAYPHFWMVQTPELEDIEWYNLCLGATVRSKRSIFLLDLGGYYWFGSPSAFAYLDVGLCVDLFMLRIGLVGGIEGSFFWVIEEGFDYSLNIKPNIDIKLGKVTAGLSALIPFGIEDKKIAPTYYTPFLISASIMYWF
jgi:hypothetical protein